MSQQGEDSVLTALETVNTSLTLIQRRIGNIETRLSSVQSEVEAKIEGLGPYLHQINEKSRTNNFQVLTGVDLGFINRTIQKLILAQTQEQILEVHLKETQRYIKRGILFLEQETKYLPWKSIGFESESIEEVVAVDLEDPIIRAARQKRIIYRVDASAELFPWLKRMGEIPHACICIPFAFEDFVPIVFYGDSFETIPIDTLELLTHLTVLVLKNNYLQSVGKDKASLAQQSWIQGGEREKHLTRPVPVLETESEPTLPQKGDQALTVLEEAVAQLEKELETSPSWSGLKKPDTQLEVKAQSEEDQSKVSFKKWELYTVVPKNVTPVGIYYDKISCREGGEAKMAKNPKVKEQSGSNVSTLAAKILSGSKKPTQQEIKSLAASVLSQDEKKGQQRK